MPDASPSRTQQLLWFTGIWLISVTVTVLAAAALKWLFGRMLGTAP